MGRMAPLPPVGRERAMQLVASGSLPVWLGSPHPCAMALEQDGAWRIRELVVDADEARASNAEATAKGRSWLPENYYGLGKPVGEIYAEASSREGLLEAMRTMRWPAHW